MLTLIKGERIGLSRWHCPYCGTVVKGNSQAECLERMETHIDLMHADEAVKRSR